MQEIYSSSQTQLSSYETSKVLRNTYALLAITILFSAFAAFISMQVGMPFGGSMLCSIGAIVLLWFVLPKTANSSNGIFVVFGFTGLLGAGLGPLLNHYLATASGSAIVMQALGGTALIFFGLSAYTLISRKDFSFLTGFLMAGLMVIFVLAIGNIFLHIQGLSLVVSGGFLLLSSLMIMWQTSQIIHGGERNYIMATATLYVSLYNIFTSLLHILSFISGDD